MVKMLGICTNSPNRSYKCHVVPHRRLVASPTEAGETLPAKFKGKNQPIRRLPMFSTAVVISALELGCIYSLVALALFLSFRVLNIADMTTNGAFTLGCAVSATVALAGHPFLAFPAAMLAGAAAGFITALL